MEIKPFTKKGGWGEPHDLNNLQSLDLNTDSIRKIILEHKEEKKTKMAKIKWSEPAKKQ